MEDKKATNPINDSYEENKAEEAENLSTGTVEDASEEEGSVEAEQGPEGEKNGQAADLENHISELQSELAEMKNRYLRAQADLENFRRRTRKEKEEQAKYAALPLIKALLPALDNLQRALAHSRDGNSTDGLAKGVEMVNRQIFDILEQEGLKPIPAVGEPFNPEYHDAVMQVESDEYESGTVVEELQKGYQLRDRVIRPAMVKVSQ